MPAKRDLDPGASPLHFFGAEVRQAREAADMTLADLGAVVSCDASTVSKIEAGLLRPNASWPRASRPSLSWSGWAGSTRNRRCGATAPSPAGSRTGSKPSAPSAR